MTSLAKAKALALLVPAALLAGAYGSQVFAGLVPCEMCWWQRYAHFAALAFALLALALSRLPDRGRSFVWLAALAILTSGLIGFYHAGVEAKIFEGFTRCTARVHATSTADLMNQILDAPLVRCDTIQWSFLGISMAGWNFILSTLSALLILWLSLRRPRTAA
ncbi:MAG: disulfide bond formation protein B [Alphaproteobacteria bacterium]|nr:disulfide bond formation protein B [Alphaproteobacteria bacterium]MBV9372991.1 disulfide bond formation protein B [Alphaproteobacteria bacterium]MBV9901358.1 disulfide bond formation protein B [Alphaproteobacteria bacterium]